MRDHPNFDPATALLLTVKIRKGKKKTHPTNQPNFFFFFLFYLSSTIDSLPG